MPPATSKIALTVLVAISKVEYRHCVVIRVQLCQTFSDISALIYQVLDACVSMLCKQLADSNFFLAYKIFPLS